MGFYLTALEASTEEETGRGTYLPGGAGAGFTGVSLSGGDCLRGICHWRKVNQTFPETRPEMAG